MSWLHNCVKRKYVGHVVLSSFIVTNSDVSYWICQLCYSAFLMGKKKFILSSHAEVLWLITCWLFKTKSTLPHRCFLSTTSSQRHQSYRVISKEFHMSHGSHLIWQFDLNTDPWRPTLWVSITEFPIYIIKANAPKVHFRIILLKPQSLCG